MEGKGCNGERRSGTVTALSASRRRRGEARVRGQIRAHGQERGQDMGAREGWDAWKGTAGRWRGDGGSGVGGDG